MEWTHNYKILLNGKLYSITESAMLISTIRLSALVDSFSIWTDNKTLYNSPWNIKREKKNEIELSLSMSYSPLFSAVVCLFVSTTPDKNTLLSVLLPTILGSSLENL